MIAIPTSGSYSAKTNLTVRSGKATWFRLIGVPINNGTEEYPSGDTIQAVEPWSPPSTWADTTVETLNRILNDIAQGMPNGQRYSTDNAAKNRAAWLVVQKHCPEKSKAQLPRDHPSLGRERTALHQTL